MNTERELRSQLEDLIQEGLKEESLKTLRKQMHDVFQKAQEDFEYWLQSDTAYNLAGFVVRMSEGAIEAILKGDEETMRRYLRCQEGHYTGRDRGHPIIHGRLFETGAIELRKQIVNAHAELLKNERILDLEDQVKDLVAQVNEIDQEKFSILQRWNSINSMNAG